MNNIDVIERRSNPNCNFLFINPFVFLFSSLSSSTICNVIYNEDFSIFDFHNKCFFDCNFESRMEFTFEFFFYKSLVSRNYTKNLRIKSFLFLQKKEKKKTNFESQILIYFRNKFIKNIDGKTDT